MARSLDTDLAVTPHQRDMIRLTWAGLTNQEIARAHGVSADTVGSAMRQVYRRLGIEGCGNPRVLAAVWLWRQEHGGTRHGEP